MDPSRGSRAGLGWSLLWPTRASPPFSQQRRCVLGNRTALPHPALGSNPRDKKRPSCGHLAPPGTRVECPPPGTPSSERRGGLLVTAGAGRDRPRASACPVCSKQWEELLQTALRGKRKWQASLFSWGPGIITKDSLPVKSSLDLSHHHPCLIYPRMRDPSNLSPLAQ